MHIPTLIEKKRNGLALEKSEIQSFIAGFATGKIPDYQMSALAMAIYFQGMSEEETQWLTEAMMHSGDVFTYPAGSPPKVDKHSTGGIGDKVSLVLAPLLACDDVWVPMVSGRGLGITGGTLDKLESIPGFDVNLEFDQCLSQLEKINVVMIGQTASLCPADKKLYALRDVTGTVPSQHLIIASIMSKKFAESLDRLVLDVKFGSGAFMKNRADAEELARGLERVGRGMGVDVHSLLTPMEEPLGHAVGNALEVAESVETLQGSGPSDLRNLTLDLAEKVATASREQLEAWLDDGTAWQKFIDLVEAQEGHAGVLETITQHHAAPAIATLPSPRAGKITAVDAGVIGQSALLLGAGRQKTTDAIDYAVGYDQIVKVGTEVEAEQPLLRIHARSEKALAEIIPQVRNAFEIA